MMMKLCAPLLLVVAGCAYVNPVTAVQLARMNPLEADPASMSVMLDLPEGVGVAAGSAALSLRAEHVREGVIEGTYPLEPLPGDVWRVTPEAQARLRADQARIVAWETADPDASSGSFSAGFEPCVIGDGPAADARASVRLQLEPDGGFLPLVSNVRVSALAERLDVGALRDC